MNFADFLAQRISQPAPKAQAPKPKAPAKPKTSSSHPRFPAFASFLKWLRARFPNGTFMSKLGEDNYRHLTWDVVFNGEPFLQIRYKDAWDTQIKMSTPVSSWSSFRSWAGKESPTLQQLQDFIAKNIENDSTLARKLTSPILGVASSDVAFTTLDEWHDTSVTLVLNLRSEALVPKEEVREWVKDNWLAIRKTLTVPPMPQERHGYGYDRPLPGLGWFDPKRIEFREFSDWWVRQKGTQVTLSLTLSNRDY